MDIQFPAAEVVSYQVERRQPLCDKKKQLKPELTKLMFDGNTMCQNRFELLNGSHSLFDQAELHIKGQSFSLADRS